MHELILASKSAGDSSQALHCHVSKCSAHSSVAYLPGLSLHSYLWFLTLPKSASSVTQDCPLPGCPQHELQVTCLSYDCKSSNMRFPNLLDQLTLFQKKKIIIHCFPWKSTFFMWITRKYPQLYHRILLPSWDFPELPGGGVTAHFGKSWGEEQGPSPNS